MKFSVIFLALSAVIAGSYAVPYRPINPINEYIPPSKPAPELPALPTLEAGVTVTKNEQIINPDGSYSFAFETSDGTFRYEKKEERDDPVHGKIWVTSGAYGYVSSDGTMYRTEYEADLNGYRVLKQIP